MPKDWLVTWDTAVPEPVSVDRRAKYLKSRERCLCLPHARDITLDSSLAEASAQSLCSSTSIGRSWYFFALSPVKPKSFDGLFMKHFSRAYGSLMNRTLVSFFEGTIGSERGFANVFNVCLRLEGPLRLSRHGCRTRWTAPEIRSL